MKTKRLFNKAGATALALLATIGIAPSAKAIVLVYEEGPNVGQAYTGQVQFKFTSFTNSANYAPGTTGGYTGSPNAALEQAGVTALDGLQTAGAGNPRSNGQYLSGLPAGSKLEDQWGIANVSRIEDPNGFALWTPAGKSTQLTGFLFGGDMYEYTQHPASQTRSASLTPSHR